MKDIQFVILTCDKYIETRVNTIKNTWGKDNDIVFLTDSNLNINNFIGYDTPKNYDGIYFKYLNFFKNYDFTKKNYYFFTDDDTFVNLKNLEKLELQDKNLSFAICRLLCLNPDGTDLWGNQTGTNVSIIKGDNVNLPLYYPSGGLWIYIITKSMYIYSKLCKNNSKFTMVYFRRCVNWILVKKLKR